MTTLIENGRIILDGKLVRTNILIENEKIVYVGKRRPRNLDDRIDATDKLVLPGIVDAHAHIYDPMFPNREDFESGTKAAAAGGVTTVIDMVLSTPVDTVDRVEAKIHEGERSSLLDFSLHAGMMNSANLSNIKAIAALGVRSFKTFTCKPYYVDDLTLMSLLRETEAQSSILNVHAEDEQTANQNYEKLLRNGRMDPLAHLLWKPNIAEERAVKKLISLTRILNSRLHISHLSSRQGVTIVRNAKRRHVKVTAETCPHYLTLTGSEMKKQGPYVKMNPSLKSRQDVESLWRGLRNGSVDIVTSEHAPGERTEKEVGWTNIWQAWGGIPAIETMLPVLLSEGVHKKKVNLSTLQRVCCEKPAKIFGLYPRKGAIRKNSDADIVIIDLKKNRTVRGEKLHYKVGWTPYENWKLTGWPTLTMVRGRIIFENEQIIGKKGLGKFIPMQGNLTC
ncbi:MAG TPA: dihydroorotase family protein [Candidatus Saccharimonadales bacterium]|nr:dihydroorotase family protein [Candidatus Saccharimonadales bacterium]